MEPRLVVAYSLITVLVAVGIASALVLRRQRARRRRRLRGIKDHPSSTQQRHLA